MDGMQLAMVVFPVPVGPCKKIEAPATAEPSRATTSGFSTKRWKARSRSTGETLAGNTLHLRAKHGRPTKLAQAGVLFMRGSSRPVPCGSAAGGDPVCRSRHALYQRAVLSAKIENFIDDVAAQAHDVTGAHEETSPCR